MQHFKKGAVSPIVIAIVVAIILAGGAYVYLNYFSSDRDSSSVSTGAGRPAQSFDDADLRITYTRISQANNSSAIFNALPATATVQADQDFLNTYVISTSSKALPPIATSEKILTRYAVLVKALDASKGKDYQCSLEFGDNCAFGTVMKVGYLGVLQALVFFEQNKIPEATARATDVVELGKKMTRYNDNILAMIVGWVLQDRGYSALLKINSVAKNVSLSAEEKTSLKEQLRNEQKNALKFMYSRQVEFIDYITSSTTKPTLSVIDADAINVANVYRGVADKRTWNPDETKKYFYDSYKIAMDNVDRGCTTTPKESKLDLKFDPAKKTTLNYVGKTFYLSVYASLDTLDERRCLIEGQIEKL